MTTWLTDPYNYGTDLACYDDLDANMSEAAGLDVFAQDLVHRLVTPRGSMPDDADYGLDSREDIGASFTAAEYAALPSKYAAELSQDDRVEKVDVVITLFESETLSLSFTVQPLVGPAFQFTADISDAGALVTSVTS